ncbi:DUF211 domain-containing protein [Candidatus Woesearchaeota archaeon]|nr:DUF211 domain-containing protein [Candidatus Woesearchaeota archaeon]
MGDLRLVVLDILKPHQPSILELASALSEIRTVNGVDISVYEIDSKVENVKVTIKGTDINFEKIKKVIDDTGASIHSIDKVSAGKELVDEPHTHQDDHIHN